MSDIPPIVNADEPEKRQHARRRTDHTPLDCYKLLATQEMVAGLHDSVTGVNERLDQGHERMCNIEASIEANNIVATKGLERLEKKQDANNAATEEILEIVASLKGFGKMVSRVGSFLVKWGRRVLTFVGWIAGILAPVAVLYYTIKDGISHK